MSSSAPQNPDTAKNTAATAPTAVVPIPFREALAVWIKISLLSFGGPAGQIALMHRLIVDEKKWIGNERFLHALNFCMVLPGPEAQQLTIYLGWLMHRVWGGIVAGVLFVLPGAVTVLLLSILYAGFQDVMLVEALFFGIKAAVLAIVIQALIKIAQKTLHRPQLVAIAGIAFLAVFFANPPFPLVIILAGLTGWVLARDETASQAVIKAAGQAAKTSESAAKEAPHQHLEHAALPPSAARNIKVLAICLTLWLAPLLGMWMVLGPSHVFVQEAVFFSQMAMVTFGGAYAVLAYMAQQAVGVYGWLNVGEMLDGLGMAETTPGPLIMVVQFVGFMGAYRNPGMLDPFLAGTLGAAITTWVTFAPCFLWIFLGAPYIERLRGNRHLSAALKGITAAIVGVMLNLALWFGMRVMFHEMNSVDLLIVEGLPLTFTWPEVSSIDLATATIAISAFLAMARFKVGMIKTLAVSAAVGVVYGVITVL